jgi:hypothetical protein
MRTTQGSRNKSALHHCGRAHPGSRIPQIRQPKATRTSIQNAHRTMSSSRTAPSGSPEHILTIGERRRHFRRQRQRNTELRHSKGEIYNNIKFQRQHQVPETPSPSPRKYFTTSIVSSQIRGDRQDSQRTTLLRHMTLPSTEQELQTKSKRKTSQEIQR